MHAARICYCCFDSISFFRPLNGATSTSTRLFSSLSYIALALSPNHCQSIQQVAGHLTDPANLSAMIFSKPKIVAGVLLSTSVPSVKVRQHDGKLLYSVKRTGTRFWIPLLIFAFLINCTGSNGKLRKFILVTASPMIHSVSPNMSPTLQLKALTLKYLPLRALQ